jgi:hypothetical protein
MLFFLPARAHVRPWELDIENLIYLRQYPNRAIQGFSILFLYLTFFFKFERFLICTGFYVYTLKTHEQQIQGCFGYSQ